MRKISVLLLTVLFSVSAVFQIFAAGPASAALPQEGKERQTISLSELPPAESGFYDSYFTGACFVGDSITQGLQNYVLYQRQKEIPTLSDAKFFAATSYSLSTAAGKFNASRTNLKYQGKSIDIAEGLKLIAPEKIFLMIGVNDLPCYNIEGNLKTYASLVNKIKTACPDSQLIIESCTPITAKGQKKGLTNPGMDAFNKGLQEIAAQYGCGYADISASLKDGENALNRDYSSDNYVHLNNAGLSVWVQELRKYARDQVIKGRWVPAELEGVFIDGIVPEVQPTPEPETLPADETAAEPETKHIGPNQSGSEKQNGAK